GNCCDWIHSKRAFNHAWRSGHEIRAGLREARPPRSRRSGRFSPVVKQRAQACNARERSEDVSDSRCRVAGFMYGGMELSNSSAEYVDRQCATLVSTEVGFISLVLSRQFARQV